MGFFKDMQLKGKFKKGKMVPVSELPDQEDRDRFLVEYSTKNNIPIIISQQKRFSDLKYVDINVEIYRLATNYTLEIKEAGVTKVLVDESVDIGMITWLKDQHIEICGGFS